MAKIRLNGMTWDHRRAVDPLLAMQQAFERECPDIEIAWHARSLSGFECTPIDELASEYDLIVLDHPFMGFAARSGCLLELDSLGLADGDFVGPSLATYRMEGKLWAVPIDAACQVAVSRPDLMARIGAAPPRDWLELIRLAQVSKGQGLRLAIGLKGVHSLMTFFTLMANLGTPCAIQQDAALFEPAAARYALGLMRDLLSGCPPEVLDWNSIALHDQMASRSDLVFCPAVYCYATYAEADHVHSLRFHDFPGPSGPRGSTIGGTGLAVSAASYQREAALAYARFAARLSTQTGFAHHHGQPARRECWEDEAINARFGGCYHDTRATIEQCWIRPRYDGYLAFQETGGDLIESHLRGALSEDYLLDRLARLHVGAST
ncbi:extracellular solute-binding protein [Aestuariivirga sp.]|jgi:multiple sugar transport system substrate-binding protein|uniref:extracellular solute-binding protein n=1 Tax=Aestuariivirga sp. TaxID=2650926 RepID=UPI0037838344